MPNTEYYNRMKRRSRNTAVWFSKNADTILRNHNITAADWKKHFETTGKRYGLLREFIKLGVV